MKDRRTHITSDSLKLWYEALLNRFNTINEASNSIDNKFGIILAASVAILTVSAPNLSQHSTVLGWIGVVGLTLVVVITITGLHIRSASSEVHSTEEQPSYYYENDQEFTWQLIADIEYAIENNTKINRTKSILCYLAIYCFVISGVVVFVSYFWTVL